MTTLQFLLEQLANRIALNSLLISNLEKVQEELEKESLQNKILYFPSDKN